MKNLPQNPKSIPWRTFFESRTPDADNPPRYFWRVFSHKAPTLDVTAGDFAMASPAERYADKPRLVAKRRRAVERALRRGRRTQAAKKLASYAGA